MAGVGAGRGKRGVVRWMRGATRAGLRNHAARPGDGASARGERWIGVAAQALSLGAGRVQSTVTLGLKISVWCVKVRVAG